MKISASDRGPTTSSGLSSADWLACLRKVRRCEEAARVLGSSWFLVLAFFSAGRLFTQIHAMNTASGPIEWSELLCASCLLLFYMTLAWFILLRSPPTAQADGLLPSLIAFAGTYLPWTIVILAPSGTSTGRGIASATFLLAGAVLMIVVIRHLGRSFSIVPQTRMLVRTGPYAIVRNPLYLAEGLAFLGAVLQYLSPLTVTLFVMQCALQIRRIFYEEDLLRRSLPDYDAYARSTPRLIPCIW